MKMGTAKKMSSVKHANSCVNGSRVTNSDESDESADAWSINGYNESTTVICHGPVVWPYESNTCFTGCMVVGATGTCS